MTARAPSSAPSFVLGLGLGGFVDGIVLHQLLGWHHMISSSRPPDSLRDLDANTVADGVFHAGTWVLVLAGTLMLVSAWRRGQVGPSWSSHAGLLLAGWGAFNLVEGLVDHHLLGVHHVRDDLGAPLSWDLGFLALGLALLVGGLALHRRAVRVALTR